MTRNWTFGKKIAAGFAVSSAMLIGIGLMAYLSIESLIGTSYSVTHTHKVMENISDLVAGLEQAQSIQRGYIITGDEAYLDPYTRTVEAAPRIVKALRQLTADNAVQQRRLDQIEPLVASRLAVLKRGIDQRRSGGFEAALRHVASGEGKTMMDDLRNLIGQMDRMERDLLRERAGDAETTVQRARFTIALGSLLCLAFVIAAGSVITRSLGSQIGAAVGHVQSSSVELQAAASQQASGAKEQATAMSEISTTISELVATSRQIAESAQRVAQIADQTVNSARGGTIVVEKGLDSMTGIRRQVDQVVSHMLDLGRKSQEIGAVLDIVAELAEQTNILAINATIEATAAGDAGKRFAVVADEIRKLADRVGNSTKQIRTQIEDVRSAVNTTVMATESGAKAVENGARQFDEISQGFKQIAELVATTTDAAREIELSTKQQATAAEQVRIAVTEVAQTTRETETSSSQTLQTASQLAGLSSELRRMIQAQAA
jgi:methyl-accepting chemotaxis protein